MKWTNELLESTTKRAKINKSAQLIFYDIVMLPSVEKRNRHTGQSILLEHKAINHDLYPGFELALLKVTKVLSIIESILFVLVKNKMPR